jgi:subtilisin family serine protease
MGTAVGDDGAGNQIGMAPGATWIGCRDMDRGAGTPATYTACLEFFLAPWPQGGGPAEGDPSRSPDVTINSWACPPSEGCAPDTLESALEAQRAAGILTVAAAGNSGPGCRTITDPPGLSGAALSVGALQTGTDSVATFSSRGPVSADGSGRPKPDLMAPGTGIRSSVPSGGYAQNGFSGTSMACPHVTGAAALVLSAQPALRGHPDALRELLVSTAVPIPLDDCASSGVPNNVFGWGRLDVKAAVDAARDRPILLSLSPGSGPSAGGTEVALLGANLAPTTTVSFGSTAASVRSAGADGRRLVVTVPPGTGSVDVTVTHPTNGTKWRLAGAFRYLSCSAFPLTAWGRTPACVGYPIALFAATVPGASYRWSGPAGFASTQQNPVIFPASLENAGLYTVTALVSGCPAAEARVEVGVVPVPEEGAAVIAGCAPGPEER